MNVEKQEDGSLVVTMDPGERVVWGMSHAIAIEKQSPYVNRVNGCDVRTVRFIANPYVWFGTDNDVYPRFDEQGNALANPRQWRLYADGTLSEGPKGYYAPNIHFPEWPENQG